MKITVVGAGYVGLSIGLILSRKHKVFLLDIDDSKIELINLIFFFAKLNKKHKVWLLV